MEAQAAAAGGPAGLVRLDGAGGWGSSSSSNGQGGLALRLTQNVSLAGAVGVLCHFIWSVLCLWGDGRCWLQCLHPAPYQAPHLHSHAFMICFDAGGSGFGSTVLIGHADACAHVPPTVAWLAASC